MFTLFKGQKIFFFQNEPKYGLVVEKKIKNSSSSGGGEGGVRPEMTNVIFFFFLMKASLSARATFFVLCWILTTKTRRPTHPSHIAIAINCIAIALQYCIV